MSLPGEFELIRRYFAPLAGPGSLSLTDDAAVIEPRPGWSLVLTADTVISGDMNGDGVADFSITFTGLHTFSASDFTL